MNDFHLMSLVDTAIAERRAEADRQRLARTARAAGHARAGAIEAPGRPRAGQRRTLGAILGRVALFQGTRS
ncbi:MAG: hypothetical protein PVG27_07770 [Chloroflexota bacterium]|jgi:hypothetical protein